MRLHTLIIALVSLSVFFPTHPAAGEAPLRVGTFAVDATPPLGSPLAYDPMKEVVMPLSCRGVVLLGAEKPVVLCVVDWIGVGNDGHKLFRRELAEAAGTTVDRVALHAVHQHDAPTVDFSAERIFAQQGLSGLMFDVEYARRVVRNAASAVSEAIQDASAVTHLGIGEGTVDKVASNRRIQGPDGNVLWTRYTAGASQERNREAPIGTIDPKLKLIAFYKGDTPLGALTYYATHPQSYYRTGGANPDFPGMARQMREEATGIFHVHFTGAGGNIGAGKWNDGSPPYRKILAERLASGMQQAWDTMRRTPVDASDLGWATVPVALPLADHLVDAELEKRLAAEETEDKDKPGIAKALAWVAPLC